MEHVPIVLNGQETDGRASSLVKDVIPSPRPFGYRLKITPHYPSSRAGESIDALGFRIRGRYRKVVDVDKCVIAAESVNNALAAVRKNEIGSVRSFDEMAKTFIMRGTLLHDEGIPLDGHHNSRFFSERKQRSGASSKTSGQKLLAFIDNLKSETQNPTLPLARRLGLDPNLQWPQPWPPKGFTVSATTNPNAVVTDVVNGQIFRGPANIFFQLNASILGHLTHHVRSELQKYVGAFGLRTLVDAYCGSGLFALQCSFEFERVIGLEVDNIAIRWARTNAADNNVKNVKFLAGDVSTSFDVSLRDEDRDKMAVVVDPSKKGCGPAFMEVLHRFNPKVIVYVSCSVESQVQDLLLMQKFSRDGVSPAYIRPFEAERIRARTKEETSDETNSLGFNFTREKRTTFYLAGKKVTVGGDGKVLSTEDAIPTGGDGSNSVQKQVKLKVKGYRVANVQPFDLFPHTGSIENVVTLVREDT
ncbi:tRNA(m5U54)methyltransferase [Phlyctochytrium bullatum]|nr:tRNA(m5U54)methyltransferase [Phlyctochytrium bullatum]